MKHFLLAFLFLLSSGFAFGQNLVEYDFTGESGNQISTSPFSTTANVVASVFNRGVGLNANGGTNSINSNGFTIGTPLILSNNEYYQFTLTPNSGYKLDLGTLNFGNSRSGTGPQNYDIRTSLDGYASSVQTASITSIINCIFPAAFNNVTTAITIRIYGYNAMNVLGTWRITSLTLTGVVTSTAPSNINLTFDDNGDPNIARGSNRNVILRTQAKVTSSTAILNEVILKTNGTYISTDIEANGFKLWYSTDNFFNAGATQISSVGSVSGNGETITFTGLSQSLPILDFNYFFLTADVSPTATLNNMVGIANTTTADFTFALPSNKTGIANNGTLHTIIGLNTGTIMPTSLCVTSSQGELIDIPFTYSPIALYTGTFTAQLSDASGSFATSTSIGSVTLDNSGSQTISATIPAGTSQGSSYRIRVVSSVPNVKGADNGTNINIDLLTVSITPTATQNLSQFQNGDVLTATESHPIQSRRWKYSTMSGSGYTNFLETDPTQRPYFETVGTYYMVVESLFACGKSVVSNEVQINVAPFVGTRLFPGDMAIVGWDANISSGDDEMAVTNLVPITKGTKFLIVNATYENGNAANVRTNKWQEAKVMEFTYEATATLPAGSIISFYLPVTSGNPATNIRINGANVPPTTLKGVRTGTSFGGVNITTATSQADQIYIMQGNFNDLGTDLDGYILFGMTNGFNWIPFSSNVTTTNPNTNRISRLHPHILCINTVHPTQQLSAYFNTSNPVFRNASQRAILGYITNMANWTNTTSLSAAIHSTTFTVTSSTIKSQWIGNKDENWFDCQNWSSLYVPDRFTNVEFTATALFNNCRINESANFSDDFLDIAEVKNIVLSNKILKLVDNRAARLDVYEDLTIQNMGYLDMDDDAGSVPDGTINIRGNWINTIGTANFEEGESLIVFEGGNNQSVTTLGGEESFYDVTLNCGKDLTINTETIIKREFIFQSGNVFAATSNPLTFDVNAFHTGANAVRHIRGSARRRSNKVESFVFPIGKSEIYRPLSIHTQIGGTITQFFAEYFYAGYGMYQPVVAPLNHVSTIEHWILNRESGTANAQLTLSWGVESQVGNLGSLAVVHWTNSNQWESRGNSLTTGSTSLGTIKSSDIITQFSPFALGSVDDTNLLPITWLSFDAKYNKTQNNVLLEWATLSESENQFFAVERSENETDFKEIGIKTGALNASSIKNYQFWDFEPLHHKTYYRIKQMDLDGKFSYSTVKMIEAQDKERIGITNHQNKTILYATLQEATKAKVKIYDTMGTEISVFEVALKQGRNELDIPLVLSQSVYLYKIEVENQSNFVSGKFLIK